MMVAMGRTVSFDQKLVSGEVALPAHGRLPVPQSSKSSPHC